MSGGAVIPLGLSKPVSDDVRCADCEETLFIFKSADRNRAEGTPTGPWVMAYGCSMGCYKIYHFSLMIGEVNSHNL